MKRRVDWKVARRLITENKEKTRAQLAEIVQCNVGTREFRQICIEVGVKQAWVDPAKRIPRGPSHNTLPWEAGWKLYEVVCPACGVVFKIKLACKPVCNKYYCHRCEGNRNDDSPPETLCLGDLGD